MLFKDIGLYIIKIFVGAFLAAGAVAVMMSVNTGEPVMGLLFNASSSSLELFDDLLQTAASKLPFAGYILDVFGISANFQAVAGYGILHDFCKAILLFLSTHALSEIIRLVWKSLAALETNNRFFFSALLHHAANIFVGLCIGLCSVLFTLLLHDFLLSFWIEMFGNGFLSNIFLLIALSLLTISVYALHPVIFQETFGKALFTMLIDFGLILCAVTEVLYLQLADQFPAAAANHEGWYYVGMVVPLVFCLAGFCILLHFKFNRK